ncbi:MAG: hypothetical protein U0791_03385 [Gemmataceae bacterium]
MARRVSMMVLAAALVASAAGCRSSCSKGWFTSASRGPAECQLVGRPGEVVIGTPVPGGTYVPGPAGGGSGELPFPQPNELIPRTGVPVPPAIPSPAPGDGGAAFLPAPKNGVPVKINH